MTDTAFIPDSQQPVDDGLLERLRSAAHASSSWDVVHRPARVYSFVPRIRAARQALKDLEMKIAQVSLASVSEDSEEALFSAAVHELRANIRQLRSAVAGIPDNVLKFPHIIHLSQKAEPRVAMAAQVYLRAVNGEVSASTFRIFIQELQSHEPLTINELWNMPAFLKFVLLESVLDGARALLRIAGPALVLPTQVRLRSLRLLGLIDWDEFIEPLIVFDAALCTDPAEAYAHMDFESRNLYRNHVAFIARYSDCFESEVAQAALDLAYNAASHKSGNARIDQRRIHIGYYLLGKGLPQLANRVGFHPPILWRVRNFVRTQADEYYVTGILLCTIFFIAAALFPLLSGHESILSLAVTVVLMLLPASQCATDMVNHAVTAFFDPEILPKLDFSKEIPAEFSTLVAVPSLLLNEKQVRKLATDLEIRFLANRDPHLHFALITDLPDSVSMPHKNDSDPLVELAKRLIEELNSQYASSDGCPFLLLHRRRVFNRRQGVWMGWERKRGKLLELNRLLTGEEDTFPIKVGYLDVLPQVRYILTLDSDTQLPRGAATRLIGCIAHPLNQAVIDPKRRIVTEGYGILQPRMGVSVQSVSRSRLASIYSGQTGLDIYTHAVSDPYQDLFGEGIFTGKGIYEVETLHAVLNRRFPRNALLSHDLIEGAYARAGLATDIELIDDYPSHYSAYSRRKHRWLRGDWQIVQWIFSRVPEESGRWVPNPISDISRWKVFDNLRRSLVDPFLFILFIAGWLGLPGGPRYWMLVLLTMLIFPHLVQLAFGLIRGLASGQKGSVSAAFYGFRHAALLTLFNLVFLLHQTLLAFDAVVRSLVRRFITGERLLEWETAAQAESRSVRRVAIDRYLVWTPLVAAALTAMVYFLPSRKSSIFFAVPILLLWSSASLVTAWLDKPPRKPQQRIGPGDRVFLCSHALRIWRFFQQFGGETNNYLIPDHVEEDGFYEASRTSPTNIGLLLNSRLAAYDLGFLTAPELVQLSQCSLDAIVKLEKFRGHLLNWYDTRTLNPLTAARFVSTVDSGNFVASLYTLHAGICELLQRPLLSGRLIAGLKVHLQMIPPDDVHAALLHKGTPHQSSATQSDWIDWLPFAEAGLSGDSGQQDGRSCDLWPAAETYRRITAILALLRDYIPWMLPEYGPLRAIPELAITGKFCAPSIEDALRCVEILEERLDRMASTGPRTSALAEQLRSTLPTTRQNLLGLAARIQAVAADAKLLAEETDFAFLIDPGRKMLSIGYDLESEWLNESCYDVLASEARVAVFLAVARGNLPQQSWFRLASQHVYACGRFLLISWSGTMFEYLMPALWMRSYPDTLLARTQGAAVRVQRSFCDALKIPWGISESGYARKDSSGHYRYKAFGIPGIALDVDAQPGPVISPYSTFLALSVDAREALRNLRRMDTAGWGGRYGLYEAVDYIDSPRTPVLVREWMAHHQGMSLLAIANLLNADAMQRRFHANPLIQATETLLHELPVRNAVLRSSRK